jgi:hypothetical protein
MASPPLIVVSIPHPPKADKLPAEMILKKALRPNRRPITRPLCLFYPEPGYTGYRKVHFFLWGDAVEDLPFTTCTRGKESVEGASHAFRHVCAGVKTICLLRRTHFPPRNRLHILPSPLGIKWKPYSEFPRP